VKCALYSITSDLLDVHGSKKKSKEENTDFLTNELKKDSKSSFNYLMSPLSPAIYFIKIFDKPDATTAEQTLDYEFGCVHIPKKYIQTKL